MRAIRRRELFRIAAADLLGLLDVAEVGYALTDVTAATLEGALAAAPAGDRGRAPRARCPPGWRSSRWAGFGGDELGYGSDADVMFVHDPLPGADRRGRRAGAARDVANEFRRLLALPGTDPALEVDADLRPEGKQGPLVRTLESYAALLRDAGRWSGRRRRCCGPAPIVGDADLVPAVHRADRPAALPGGRASAADDVLRGAADQGPRRRRAAAPRRRPGHPPQARPRRPRRRRVDRPAAADAARRRRCPGCAPPGPSTRSQAARRGRPARRVATPTR